MDWHFLAGAALVLSLSACGTDGTPEPAEPAATSDDAPTASPETAAVNTEGATTSAPEELGTLKEAGFGQTDEYVWVTALVHNNSAYVGQTVTVNFNVLDAEDEAGPITVYMDKRHGLYLMGTTVDYHDGLDARGFVFENPNATQTCGCGSSFAA